MVNVSVPLAVGVVLLTAPLAASCSRACSDDLRPSIDVHLRNAQSGAPICDGDLTVTDGDFKGVLQKVGCQFFGLPARPGTYDVRASSAGYATAEVHGVVVPEVGGHCPTVETAQVVIDLEPDAAASPATDGGAD